MKKLLLVAFLIIASVSYSGPVKRQTARKVERKIDRRVDYRRWDRRDWDDWYGRRFRIQPIYRSGRYYVPRRAWFGVDFEELLIAGIVYRVIDGIFFTMNNNDEWYSVDQPADEKVIIKDGNGDTTIIIIN